MLVRVIIAVYFENHTTLITNSIGKMKIYILLKKVSYVAITDL
jgi:hypothetical protein